jgi:hypothetical protein
MPRCARAAWLLIACAACSASDVERDAAGNDTSPPAAAAGTDAPAVPDTARAADSPWTGAALEGGDPGAAATLRSVRVASHDAYDRIVFDFGADPVPGYRVAPLAAGSRASRCGSGEPVQLPGERVVEVTFIPARAHTEDGAATVTDRSRAPELPVVRALELVCDFEAHVVWAIGVRRPARVRVEILDNPNRLVLDLTTPGPGA